MRVYCKNVRYMGPYSSMVVTWALIRVWALNRGLTVCVTDFFFFF